MNHQNRPIVDPVCLALIVDPRRGRALETLRMALVVLAAAGNIVVNAAARAEKFVRIREAPAPDTPAHIDAVYEVLRAAAVGGWLSRSAAQQALMKVFGWRFQRYVHAQVAPALVAHRLLRIETRRFLWLFTVRRMLRNVDGESLAKRLTALLAELDSLPTLATSDPTRALQTARAAGPFLLLSPAARKALPLLQSSATASLSIAAYQLVDSHKFDWMELFEYMDALIGIDFEALVEAINAIADFGGDGGYGGGSDDGGGDGGGGD